MASKIHTENYCCPKCHNREAAVDTCFMYSSGLTHLLGVKAKYITYTCTLCGYTEMYNQAVYAQSKKPQEAGDEASQGV